jgi:hypothetical protein
VKGAELVITSNPGNGEIVRCANHTLQLDIRPTLKKHIPSLYSKIKDIVALFAHSVLLNEELEKM